MGTVLLFFDNFTVIFICLYFKYISRYWLWFQLFGVGLNALALIGVLFIPESPEYLYSFYRFEECRNVIRQIGRWNLGKDAYLNLEEFEVERELLKIRFSREVADSPENFRLSLVKGK